MNLGLGTSAGIGERKSEVSDHRDVTYKLAREIQRKVNKWLPRKCLQSSVSKRTDQNKERTKGMRHAITQKVFLMQFGLKNKITNWR